MSTESKKLDLPQSEHVYKHAIEMQPEPCHDGASSPAHGMPVGAHHHPQQSIFTRVWHFVLHYLEMCMAMCVGGITLNVLFFTGAAQLGYANLPERYPEFSILIIGILLAIPMAAWMRIRGHDWRSNLEMSTTSIILAILLIGAAWLGVMPKSDMLEWIKRLACPVMLIPMLLRLNLYTSSHASHAQHVMPKAV